MVENAKCCVTCGARRPVLWLIEPFVAVCICPWCDNVEVWGPGFDSSMSVSAWVIWVESSIVMTGCQDDDPPPPNGPHDKLDRTIQRWIDEAHHDP